MAEEKVMISIDGELQEAKGEVLEQLLQARKDVQTELERIENEQMAKAAQKAVILERLGLTEEELKVVLS